MTTKEQYFAMIATATGDNFFGPRPDTQPVPSQPSIPQSVIGKAALYGVGTQPELQPLRDWGEPPEQHRDYIHALYADILNTTTTH
jgi:hypothetical protein